MTWIDTLEHKFGRFAIPGLIRLVAACNLIVFVAYKLNPGILELLVLDPSRVMAGEVWRLVTYLFIPSFGRPMFEFINVFFYLWFLWLIGEGLEQAWGAFRLNLFYLVGMLGTTIAAFFFGSHFSNGMLNTSMLFAFATLYPDFQILLFLILPVRIKWVAWFSFAGVAFMFLFGSGSVRMAILAALSNYALFFWRPLLAKLRDRRYVHTRQQEFKARVTPMDEALHDCAVCHRNENTNPELDFRVAKNGDEYCIEHLPGRA